MNIDIVKEDNDMTGETHRVEAIEGVYSPKPLSPAFRRGLTLLELIVVVAIIAILAGIAIPAYNKYIEKTRVNIVIVDIQNYELDINRFYAEYGRYPNNLAELSKPAVLDPWGRPYEYLNIADADTKGKGKLRKDKNLVPINSDYDLYSVGPDGDSVPPLTAKKSQDDIIRANNGAYVGPASGY